MEGVGGRECRPMRAALAVSPPGLACPGAFFSFVFGVKGSLRLSEAPKGVC